MNKIQNLLITFKNFKAVAKGQLSLQNLDYFPYFLFLEGATEIPVVSSKLYKVRTPLLTGI